MVVDGNGSVSAFEHGRLAQRVEQLEGQVREMADDNEERRKSSEGLRIQFTRLDATLTGLKESIDGMRATVWKVVGAFIGFATLAVAILAVVMKR